MHRELPGAIPAPGLFSFQEVPMLRRVTLVIIMVVLFVAAFANARAPGYPAGPAELNVSKDAVFSKA